MLMREKASALDSMEEDKDARENEMEMHRVELMKKAEVIRSVRLSHLERREAEEKERLVRAQKASQLRNQHTERTYKLAEELLRLKNLEAQELIELRRSKRTLRFTTACDYEEEQTRLLENKILMEKRSTELMNKWNEDKTLNEIQMAKDEERKRQYRADSQNLIIEKRRILREQSEEEQRERKVLEEMAEVIHEEDVRAEERRKEIRARLQTERELFFEARKKWKEIVKDSIREEEKKIGEIIFEKETQYKKQMEVKSDIEKAREATIEKIARKMLDEEIKMTERDDICTELFLEKQRNEVAQEARRLALEKQEETAELYDAMVQCQMADIEKKMKERAMDESFTRHLDGIRRTLDEQNKRKREERRRKNLQYGEELKDSIMKNRMKYAVKLLARGREVKDVCKDREDINPTNCD